RFLDGLAECLCTYWGCARATSQHEDQDAHADQEAERCRPPGTWHAALPGSSCDDASTTAGSLNPGRQTGRCRTARPSPGGGDRGGQVPATAAMAAGQAALPLGL